MKQLIVTFLTLLASIAGYGQKNFKLLEEGVYPLFYSIPIHSDKFEVRKMLHLDQGATDVAYQEWCKCISANLSNHSSLEYLGRNSRFVAWFDTTEYRTNGRKVISSYDEIDLSRCVKQVEQIRALLEPLCYKIETSVVSEVDGAKNRKGEGYFFYSSKENHDKDRPFLTVSYMYMDLTEYNKREFVGKKEKSFYELEVFLRENDL